MDHGRPPSRGRSRTTQSGHATADSPRSPCPPAAVSPDPEQVVLTVADLGEFGLIEAMAARMPPGPGTVVGIGDDAAVFLASGALVVASTDLLVEGRHFRRDWSSPADVGGKAAAQNLADLAAMGATPRALLAGLAAPAGLPAGWAVDLASGLAEEAGRAGASVLGGDLSEASEIVLAVTALGVMTGGQPVTRSGARPGDLVAVAGQLGPAAAGLALLEAGLAGPAGAVAAHRRPRPPYASGPEAAAAGAHAMIDVSDGLIQDLGHIAAASQVVINVETHRLQPPPVLAAAASALGLDPVAVPMTWMLAGGEDHALAAAFPAGTRLPSGWAVIGQVDKGQGMRVDGKTYRGNTGWSHFR